MADDWRQPYQSTSTWNGSKRREPGNGPHKRGLNTKLHLAVDAHRKPVRAQLTAETAADWFQAIPLLEGPDVKVLLADKGYDIYAILEYTQERGITAVILPKHNRKVQREYDRHLYKLRHPVENAFLYLKCWRGIAIRYAKNASFFLAVVHIRCIFPATFTSWRHDLKVNIDIYHSFFILST